MTENLGRIAVFDDNSISFYDEETYREMAYYNSDNDKITFYNTFNENKGTVKMSADDLIIIAKYVREAKLNNEF